MRLLALLVVLLSGCAQNPIKDAWLPGDAYWEKARVHGARLIYQDRSTEKFVPARSIDNLLAVRAKLEEVSFVRAELAIVDTDQPNAFAFTKDGFKHVAFSISFLEHLGNDLDALATTMGHELAHLELKHAEKRQGREAGRQAAGFALGFLLGPLGTIADVGASAYILSFTRDEEREADALGLKWASKAGFSPCGQAKLAAMFAKYGTAQISFLSTHPGIEERNETANQESLKRDGRACN